MSDDLSRRLNAAVYIFGGTPHGNFLVAVREEFERLRRRERVLQDIIDMYGKNLPTSVVALAALEEEKK